MFPFYYERSQGVESGSFYEIPKDEKKSFGQNQTIESRKKRMLQKMFILVTYLIKTFFF